MEDALFETGRRVQGGRAKGASSVAIIHNSRRPPRAGRTGRSRPRDHAEATKAEMLRSREDSAAPAGVRAGFTLIELLAAIMAIVIVLALLIPAWAGARRHGKVAACMDNLRLLHRAEAAWEAAHPGSSPGLGKACWLKLVESSPPMAERKALACPLAPPPGPDGCSYWGPAADVTPSAPEDPVGCDEESNHDSNRREGGNILRRSGEVVNDKGDFWLGVVRGKCRP